MLLCIAFHFKTHFCGAAAARDCVPVCRPWRSACNDSCIFIHLNQSPCTIAPLDTCMHRCSGIHRHRTHHVRLGYMRPERQLHTRAARPRVSRLLSVRCARAAASMCRCSVTLCAGAVVLGRGDMISVSIRYLQVRRTHTVPRNEHHE